MGQMGRDGISPPARIRPDMEHSHFDFSAKSRDYTKDTLLGASHYAIHMDEQTNRLVGKKDKQRTCFQPQIPMKDQRQDLIVATKRPSLAG